MNTTSLTKQLDIIPTVNDIDASPCINRQYCLRVVDDEESDCDECIDIQPAIDPEEIPRVGFSILLLPALLFLQFGAVALLKSISIPSSLAVSGIFLFTVASALFKWAVPFQLGCIVPELWLNFVVFAIMVGQVYLAFQLLIWGTLLLSLFAFISVNRVKKSL